MAQLGKELLEKVKDYHEHYEQCKEKSYASAEFQKHFQMADELIRFIIEGFKNGTLDAKDLHSTDLNFENLFRSSKNEALKKEALDAYKSIQPAIKKYLKGG